jgi:hypothetical protein
VNEHDRRGAELTRVVFELPPGAPTPTETLWAESLGNRLYRLDNAPWFAFGCAQGDVVRCEERPGDFPRFIEVVEPGGSRTVRVFVPEAPQRDAVKDEVFSMLRENGCGCEGFGAMRGLVAVTIPVEVDPERVLSTLRALERQGKAYWESGNF